MPLVTTTKLSKIDRTTNLQTISLQAEHPTAWAEADLRELLSSKSSSRLAFDLDAAATISRTPFAETGPRPVVLSRNSPSSRTRFTLAATSLSAPGGWVGKGKYTDASKTCQRGFVTVFCNPIQCEASCDLAGIYAARGAAFTAPRAASLTNKVIAARSPSSRATKLDHPSILD
jgi:hypothetical protein